MFDSTDAALSWAEDELLDKLRAQDDDEEIRLAALAVMRGLNDDERGLLATLAMRKTFAAGDVVIRHGEPFRGLLMLMRGRLSVLSESDWKLSRTASYRAGMAFGELPSMLQRKGPVKVVADTPVVVLDLTEDALDHLRESAPRVEATLMRNLSVEIGERLCNLLEAQGDVSDD